MNIKIERGNLLEGLLYVGKAISGKANTPILQGVYLETTDKGILLRGTDMDLSIETNVKAEVISLGNIVVDYKIFSEVVRKLPNAEISIEITEDNFIQLNCRKSQFNLVKMDASDYPKMPTIKKDIQITLQQSILKDMVRGTSFAIAQDDTRPILQGILFEIKDRELSLVGLDGYRLAIRKEYVDIEHNIEAVISGRNFSELSKLLKDNMEEVQVTFTDNQILFDLGNTTVISRLLQGRYVNYRSLITKDAPKCNVVVNTIELLNSIERATLMTKSDNTNLVKLEISDEKIILSSNSQKGKVREELACKAKCIDTLIISFNSKYLIDVIKNCESDEVELNMTAPLAPCLINPFGKDNTTYLVLPVRLPKQ